MGGELRSRCRWTCHNICALPGTNAVKRRVTVVDGKVEARPIMSALQSVHHVLLRTHCVSHLPGSLP